MLVLIFILVIFLCFGDNWWKDVLILFYVLFGENFVSFFFFGIVIGEDCLFFCFLVLGGVE